MQNSSPMFSKKVLLAGSVIALSLTLAACSPATKSTTAGTTTGATQLSKISFIQEAKVGYDIPVEFKVTKDGKDATAKVTFKVKEFKELPELDGTKAIAGQTFFYALYDFKGSSEITATTLPSMLYDPSAPQLVLLNDTSYAEVGGSIPGAYSSGAAKQFGSKDPNVIKLSETTFTPTAAAWYTPKADRPTLALQYTDAAGKKQYIKINY